MNNEMTPAEKSQELNSAIRFCLKRNLISKSELQMAKSKEDKFYLACEAVLRKDLYLKAHPEAKQEKSSYWLTEEEEQALLADMKAALAWLREHDK